MHMINEWSAHAPFESESDFFQSAMTDRKFTQDTDLVADDFDLAPLDCNDYLEAATEEVWVSSESHASGGAAVGLKPPPEAAKAKISVKRTERKKIQKPVKLQKLKAVQSKQAKVSLKKSKQAFWSKKLKKELKKPTKLIKIGWTVENSDVALVFKKVSMTKVLNRPRKPFDMLVERDLSKKSIKE